MKKLLLGFLLFCSTFVFGQSDMDFLGISFSNPNFTNLIKQKGWTEVKTNCYKGLYLDTERNLYLNYYEENIVNVRLVFESDCEFSILSDFYKILDYYKDYPMWKVGEDYWIIYKGQNEISVRRTLTETEIIMIDIRNENLKIH